MALITKYVREGQLYSHDNLKSIFEFADKDEFFGDFIRLLKKYRILKTVKGKKNTNAEDESLLDETDDDYVGVLDDYSDLMYLFRSIRKNPGVEDVAKQYLYYLAYKYFLDDIKIPFSDVKNYFLMPKETGIIEDVGYVELELWNSVPSMPRLVRVKKLPADLMYEKYINDETLPLTDLDK